MRNVKQIFFSALTLAFWLSCDRLETNQKVSMQATKTAAISIGIVDTIQSNILGEKRTIWVHVPDSVPGDGYAVNKMGFPVLYLLDAETNFHSVVGILHSLSKDEWNSLCPRMIVVGIPNTNRTRDLSPTHVESAVGMDYETAKSTGGGDNFTRFLENELFPFIENKYKTVPFRLLVGHSLGGVFGLHELVNHPKLFNAFIMSDPAVHWDNEKIITQLSEVLKTKALVQKSLFVSMSRNWERRLDSGAIRTDTSQMTAGSRSILRLIDVLNHNRETLNWDFKYYPNDNHTTVPHISIYDGLRFIFRHHEIPGYKDLVSIGFNAHEVITKNYDTLENQLGYRFVPPEIPLYVKIHGLLNENKTDEAYPLISLMYAHYPDLYGCWAMGDYYKRKGDNNKAIKFFQEALAYYPDEYVANEIKTLTSLR